MKISFIVPVYNCEATLARCVQSILAQTETDFEVILVNDGSRDSSLEICKSFESDERVTVLSQENRGPSAARNFGISRASGDYLAFVDSDDYIEPNYIEKIYASISEHSSDMVFMSFKFEDNESREILNTVSFPDAAYGKSEFPSALKKLIDTDIFGYQWCKVVRRSLVADNDVKLDESISLHEDLLFTCECVKRAEKISVVSAPIYHYIKGIYGLCAKFRPNMTELMDYVNEKLFAFYREINIENVEKMILERAVFTYFLVLKNDRNQSYADIKKRKAQIKNFLRGVTSREIVSHMDIYSSTVKGKKKWFYLALVKTKSLLLYHLFSKVYRDKG